jgi:hypothetical protein
MNEDKTQELTKELSDSEKLAFVVEELLAQRAWQAQISTRLEKVEAFVDERSRETRPMLELIVKEVADLGQSVKEIRADLRVQGNEDWQWKREFVELAERVAALENRAH